MTEATPCALPRLTALNLYRLTAPAPEVAAAFTALAARVRAEGEPGVIGYRFYLNPARAEARAVVDYASPDAWLGHHDIAMPWPEMKALHGLARLAEVTFLGEVTEEIRAWIAGSALTAEVIQDFHWTAGFQR